MRTTPLIAAVLALGLIGANVGTAEARDGCGPGFHRNRYGVCRPNVWGGPVFYGYRRYGWHRGWHRGWHGGRHRFGGFRHGGFHRFGRFHHGGFHRFGGFRHGGFHGGFHGGHGGRHR